VIPRILNLQGMIGIAASLLLLALVVVKAGEVRHWRKQAAHFELLYQSEQSAGARTIANYRAATEAARAADKANADRVAASQRIISERTSNDLETRLADVRARALRLQLENRAPAAAGRARGGPPVPAARQAPGAPGGPTQENGLSLTDRLLATEQAIQLDELIKWVNGQAAIDQQER
jgi:hypothetical protein